MDERLLWIPSRGKRMAAVLHLPDGRGRAPAVLMLHGFTGNKSETHRLFVHAARRLAAAGFVALRFDFLGSGDSEGEFEQMTIRGEVEDALNALRFLCEQRRVDPARLGMLGFSLGGCVAALSLPRAGDIKALVLWAPVSNPMRWMPATGVPEHPVNIGGNRVGVGFYRELPELKPLETVRAYKGAVLVLHGAADTAVSPQEGRAYESAFAHARPFEFRLLPEADHLFSTPEAEQSLLQQTLDWFRQTLASASTLP
ncbi:2-succinyl-6-hydroxy-2, 4-cyclohexadiene-1-carboxylate synthase [bacterium HR15]|nr:2-succinyl-6-hydroxy-2, 4-cyclohexadiene-1-carboxylate synthase [bacterium HR15]